MISQDEVSEEKWSFAGRLEGEGGKSGHGGLPVLRLQTPHCDPAL